MKQLFDNILPQKQQEYERDPRYSHSKGNTINISGYAIFRIGKKYKSMTELKMYEKHMERKMEVANADKSIKNELLIGTDNITDDVYNYIKGIQLRKNNVIARDVLLTASPGFFLNATELEKRKWVELNKKWLVDKFGDNCIYATLHKDETTWHISALIVPKFYSEKKQDYILANSRYFDGPEALRQWQDNYSEAMHKEFQNLKRGIRFSKAQHVAIRQFYTIVNKQIDLQDIESLTAKANNSELLQRKVLNLQNTLNIYQNFNKNTAEENKKLYTTINNLKKDKELFRDTIRTLSEAYDIPQNAIEKVLNYVSEKSKENSMEK